MVRNQTAFDRDMDHTRYIGGALRREMARLSRAGAAIGTAKKDNQCAEIVVVELVWLELVLRLIPQTAVDH